jgi:hypothetical protein
MSIRNMRVILVAALVAALLGGGVATARSLVKGKDIASNAITSSKVKNSSLTGSDIKNSSLTGADVKNGSLGIAELSRATQNLIRSGGTSSTSGKPGTNGTNGATGPRGATGATGATGPAGAAGASFDPKKVTSQTAQLFGFTPWYDTDSDASTVDFTDGGIVLSAPSGRVGVNLPIAQGTSLSTLKSITYSETGNAVLALEIYYRGGIGEYGDGTGNTGKYRGDYTTVRFEPTTDGAQSNVLAPSTRVVTSGAIGPNGVAGSLTAGQETTWGAVINAIQLNGRNAGATTAEQKKQNLDAAAILNVDIRTPGAASATNTTAKVSAVAIQLRNAAKAVEYSFGS